ncbi:hypothetical protein EW146_g3489 [Bondarzewia mesenterica]|uniref:Uncharacterized protein n=1 Tax=Bondarzewia mesenterica TaxID=1095465 RepID=A0A4S4LZL4_9AGAM|nr:hypothetical protein EW146_g3489 [Bondarzewia mesenterica]
MKFSILDPQGFDALEHMDVVHVRPAQQTKHGKRVPAQFDTVSVEQNVDEDLHGIQAGIEHPSFLAYVEWFTPFMNSPEGDHAPAVLLTAGEATLTPTPTPSPAVLPTAGKTASSILSMVRWVQSRLLLKICADGVNIPSTRCVDHKRDVKMYERAAGNKTLPSNLCLPPVLKNTGLSFHDLLSGEGFSPTFNFIHDCSHSVRNDFMEVAALIAILQQGELWSTVQLDNTSSDGGFSESLSNVASASTNRRSSRVLINDPVDPIITTLYELIAIATDVMEMTVAQLHHPTAVNVSIDQAALTSKSLPVGKKEADQYFLRTAGDDDIAAHAVVIISIIAAAAAAAAAAADVCRACNGACARTSTTTTTADVVVLVSGAVDFLRAFTSHGLAFTFGRTFSNASSGQPHTPFTLSRFFQFLCISQCSPTSQTFYDPSHNQQLPSNFSRGFVHTGGMQQLQSAFNPALQGNPAMMSRQIELWVLPMTSSSRIIVQTLSLLVWDQQPRQPQHNMDAPQGSHASPVSSTSQIRPNGVLQQQPNSVEEERQNCAQTLAIRANAATLPQGEAAAQIQELWKKIENKTALLCHFHMMIMLPQREYEGSIMFPFCPVSQVSPSMRQGTLSHSAVQQQVPSDMPQQVPQSLLPQPPVQSSYATSFASALSVRAYTGNATQPTIAGMSGMSGMSIGMGGMPGSQMPMGMDSINMLPQMEGTEFQQHQQCAMRPLPQLLTEEDMQNPGANAQSREQQWCW